MRQFEVVRSFGMYSVGAIISPTGVFRDDLLQRGWIRPIDEVREAIDVAPEVATRRRGRPRKWG